MANIFYNPKKKKAHYWVPAIFILIPIILFAIFYFVTKPAVEKYQKQQAEEAQRTLF